MNLLIVESPTKARTISRFLDKNFKITSSYGHVRDLPKSKLGIQIENNFEPSYLVPRKSKEHVDKIVESAQKAKMIYYATDGDREGEAIAWHLNELLKSKYHLDVPSKRITFHEITKEAIEEALENPRSINNDLVNAQQARRILDRLVGYSLSPFLWKKVAKGLSAGRVQSVAVRLIVEREREIRNFNQEEYWTIEGMFKSDVNASAFTASLYQVENNKIAKFDFKNEEQAADISEKLKKIDYAIDDIKEKETKKKPPPPYTTSTLQQDAYNKLGFSSKQTMLIAQQLYEGVELENKQSTGLITYMRTDSVTLSEKFTVQAREYIEQCFGKTYACAKPRIFKNRTKGAQEAHEAIRPTSVTHDPESIKSLLKKEHYKLYKLIFERAIGSQMADAVIHMKTVDILGTNAQSSEFPQKAIFRATGSTIAFEGFLKIYPLTVTENELPPLKKGEELVLEEIIPKQHFTQPPARYTDATLVKELEKRGIGRPSTYAPTIDTIQKRYYATKNEEKRFAPTKVGELVNEILEKHFSQIVDYNFTAEIENDLDRIAHHQKNWTEAIAEFYHPFAKILEKKYEELDKKLLTEEKTDTVCPACQKHKLIIKMGRFGKFLACPGFPECKHTEQLPQEGIQGTGQLASLNTSQEAPLCKKCQSHMILKVGRFGKFWACPNYPNCKSTMPYSESINMKCSLCKEGDIVIKRTRKGKIFYGCSRYPSCEFASWKKPEPEQFALKEHA